MNKYSKILAIFDAVHFEKIIAIFTDCRYVIGLSSLKSNCENVFLFFQRVMKLEQCMTIFHDNWFH